MAWEKRFEKLRVNAVAPGLIKTNFSKKIWENFKEDEVKDLMGIHRMGTPEDIAKAVAFLASDDASYVNGEILLVGGKCVPRL